MDTTHITDGIGGIDGTAGIGGTTHTGADTIHTFMVEAASDMAVASVVEASIAHTITFITMRIAHLLTGAEMDSQPQALEHQTQM